MSFNSSSNVAPAGKARDHMLELEKLVAAAQEASNFFVASKASWFDITDELPHAAEY